MCVGGKGVGIQTPGMLLQEQMGVPQPRAPGPPQAWCAPGVRRILFQEMAVGLQPTAPPATDQDI